MKFLMINVMCGIRSTGRICTDIADALTAQGHVVKIAYGRENVPDRYQKYAVRIGSEFGTKLHGLKARTLDGAGFGSRTDTEKFVCWIKEYDPDVIHLHNLHGYYINLEVLFKYLMTCGKKIVWTLHDCWSFTGHCAYFDFVNCDKWKKGCHSCTQYRDYPASFICHSERNWKVKKSLFSNIPNLTIVTPSQWLAEMVKQSYMGNYPVKVINNGVDVFVFKHTESDIKERYGITDKKVVLGVAAIWDRRKGLGYMCELSEKLGNIYQIVVIGITEEQKRNLPANVIGILRTNSVTELVEWYSAADVFVNPTLEDNYPTTNLEAIACGTPVVTFMTGGSPESAEIYGTAVEKGNVDGMCVAIREAAFVKEKNVPSVADMVKEYIELY